MASTDLVAQFTTEPALRRFVEVMAALGMPKCDFDYWKIPARRDYPWQITVSAVHPGEVDLGAMVVAHHGTVVKSVTVDTP